MAAIAVMLLLSGFSARCADKKPLTFKNASMGEIEDMVATNAGFQTRGWSGAHFGFTTYKASNGNTLAVYYDDFNKPEEAKRFLDWKVDKGFKVLSQSTNRNADGKSTEYRVELVPQSGRTDVEVMWVVGVTVQLDSCPHAGRCTGVGETLQKLTSLQVSC
jgi:hypothetical protein